MMFAAFVPPLLEVPAFDGPALLNKANDRMADASAGGSAAAALSMRMQHGDDSDHVLTDEVIAWLAAFERGDAPAAPRSPRLLRGLVKAYPLQRAADAREALLRAILQSAHRVTWRSLWFMWEHAPVTAERESIIPALVQQLQSTLARRPQRHRELPGWLGANAARMEAALTSPVPYIVGWVLRQGLPITEIIPHLGCAPSSEMGQHVLKMLASQAPADWWAMQPLQDRFVWAERAGLPIVQAVAERELHGLAARAGGPSRVHLIPEREPLRAWLQAQLGHPATSPGTWAGLSRRSADVFGWL